MIHRERSFLNDWGLDSVESPWYATTTCEIFICPFTTLQFNYFCLLFNFHHVLFFLSFLSFSFPIFFFWLSFEFQVGFQKQI